MGDVIYLSFNKLPDSEKRLLKSLPENLLICIVTGYTDLRKSISGLSQIVEAEFQMDIRSLCMYFFCGRRADRFKILMYDGDGYVVMSKRFDSRKLKWPRLGGKEGDLWSLTQRQFEEMISGEYEPTYNDVLESEAATLDDAEINTLSCTLYRSMLRTKTVPRRIYLCTGYTDLRCSVSRYCERVVQFGLDPQADSFFLFCGKRANLMKVLYYDGSGYLVITKRFDKARLIWPRKEDEMWDIVYSNFWNLLHGEAIPTAALQVFKPKK